MNLGTYIYIHYMEEDLIINLDNACRASFNVLYVIWLLAELMNNLKSGIQTKVCCVLANSYPVSIHNCLRLLARAATAAGWHPAGREFEPRLGRISAYG